MTALTLGGEYSICSAKWEIEIHHAILLGDNHWAPLHKPAQLIQRLGIYFPDSPLPQ